MEQVSCAHSCKTHPLLCITYTREGGRADTRSPTSSDYYTRVKFVNKRCKHILFYWYAMFSLFHTYTTVSGGDKAEFKISINLTLMA